MTATIANTVTLPRYIVENTEQPSRRDPAAEIYEHKKVETVNEITSTTYTIFGSARLARWLGVEQRMKCALTDV